MTTLQRPGPSVPADGPPRRPTSSTDPALNKGTAFTEDERSRARPARPAAAAGREPGRASGARLRGLPAEGRRPGAAHLPARPAGHQRGPLLPAPPRPHRGDDARSSTRRWSRRRASSSATSTAGPAACSSPTRCATRSPRSCGTAPTPRWTSSSSPTASASWASATRVPAAWASPSASSPCTRSSAGSARSGRCRSCWTWGPITPSGSTIPSTSAGATSG